MRARADAGFMLLEALIATAIFAVMMSALHTGLRTGWRAWGIANGEDAAIALAQSLIAAEGTETPLQEGARSGNAKGISWHTQVTPYNPSLPTLRTAAYGGYWVRVDVRWRDRARPSIERSLSLTSLKIAKVEVSVRP